MCFTGKHLCVKIENVLKSKTFDLNHFEKICYNNFLITNSTKAIKKNDE